MVQLWQSVAAPIQTHHKLSISMKKCWPCWINSFQKRTDKNKKLNWCQQCNMFDIGNWSCFTLQWKLFVSHRIHGTGIFTYIYHKHQLNVGKYTGPMDRMGYSMTIDMSHIPTRPDDWQVWRYFCHRRWGKGTQWSFFWKNLKQMVMPSNGLTMKIHPFPSISINFFKKNLENKLLLISINFTPKTSHSCLKKWYTRFSRNEEFLHDLKLRPLGSDPVPLCFLMSFDVIFKSCHSWSLGPSVNLHLFRSAKEKFWDGPKWRNWGWQRYRAKTKQQKDVCPEFFSCWKNCCFCDLWLLF